MTVTLPGPDRQRKLEVLCACLSRAERRIIIAGQIRNHRMVDLSRYAKQRRLIEHIVSCMEYRGFYKYSESLIRLQIARSKMAAELEGMPWA